MKLYELLENALKKQTNFISDNGEIKKWVLINKAQNFDAELIDILLQDKALKAKFFIENNKSLVFNQSLFIQFLEQKNYLNDSYTKYKNTIGLTIDEKFLAQRNEVCLVWPHKDCVLEGGQTKEDEKREEIFFNEILAQDEITQLTEPKVLTNAKKYSHSGISNFEKFNRNQNDVITDNLIIKGNNLLVLYTLKEQFTGLVKLIYIDPPYNTGGDKNIFSYNNSFNHSTWLTFMRNRLKVARELLTLDGFITIAIDHNELFYLGALADEVFGRENRIGIVTVVHNPKGRNQAKFFSENSEFLLVYAYDIKQAKFNKVAISEKVLKTFDLQDETGEKYKYSNYIRARTVWSRKNRPKNWYPIYVSKDLKEITSDYNEGFYELYPRTAQGDFSWKNIKSKFNELNKDNYFKAEKVDDKIILYHKYYEKQVLKNVWTDKKYQSEFNGTNLLKKLIGKNNFSYPKSLYAVVDVIKIMTKPGDIVMDFFGGSGTTAHAVIEVNSNNENKRQFILVEQLDEHIKVILKRSKKIMKSTHDDFTYFELKKYNQTFMDLIQDAKDSNAVLKIWDKMKAKSFLNYNIDIKVIDENIKQFKDLKFEQQKKHLCELLDKNQLYVNLSSLNDKDFTVTKEDMLITNNFYKF